MYYGLTAAWLYLGDELQFHVAVGDAAVDLSLLSLRGRCDCGKYHGGNDSYADHG